MTDKLFNLIKKITPEKWHWALEHDGYKRYFANTGWMFLGKMFTLLISFFVGIYIARYLGPSNYGILSYVISFVGLFSFLTSFGIDSIVSREIIKNHDRKDEIMGTGFYLKIVGSFLAIISVFVVSFFITKEIFILGLIWLFALNFIPQAFNIIEIYFQSQVLSKKVVTAQVVSNIISTILKIGCILLGKGIFWLVVISVIETSIYAMILIFSFRKFNNHIRKWKFNSNIAISLLKDSWPLMFASVAIGIYMKIDQVMIKNMLGNEQAGIYAVAVKLSEVWYFIPALVCTSLFPAIMNAKKDGNIIIYKKRMLKLYSLMIYVSSFIAIPISLFVDFIIIKLFGIEYYGAISVLKIHIWAGVGVFLGYAMTQYLIAENYTKIFFMVSVFGAIFNIIFNLILIPKYGINGAAFATLFSYIFSTFAIIFFKKSKDQVFLMFKSLNIFSK